MSGCVPRLRLAVALSRRPADVPVVTPAKLILPCFVLVVAFLLSLIFCWTAFILVVATVAEASSFSACPGLFPDVVLTAIAVGSSDCVSLFAVAPSPAVVLAAPLLWLSVTLLFLAVVSGVMVAPVPARPAPLVPLPHGGVMVSSFSWGALFVILLFLSAVAMLVRVLPAATVWFWGATVCW